MCIKQIPTGPHARRGVAVVHVAIGMVALLSFTALVIDLGQLYMARDELQAVADSAALAGTSSYVTDAGLVRDNDTLFRMIRERSAQFAGLNRALGVSIALETADIRWGKFDFSNPGGGVDSSENQRFNAVSITARRTRTSLNGSIAYSFAQIFGRYEGGVIAMATAVYDDRFSGFEQTDENPILVPMTIHRDLYNDMVAHGADDFSYNGFVDQTPDGVREITLFPHRQAAGAGSGNFGILNVGVFAQGTPPEEEQIRNGISPDDLIAEVGTASLDFYDDDGAPQTYDITGSPGLTVGLSDAVESRIGDVIGFFLHDQYWGNGSNTTYRMVDMRFGRVMFIDLTGPPANKRLVIQPVAYTGAGVHVSDVAGSTYGEVGSLRLVE